ncbi:MAG: DUF2286 domain-containing protein [Thermoprotei archaeon]|nr:DUF2286 domain-containing protein [Thermoprotei archaeon]
MVETVAIFINNGDVEKIERVEQPLETAIKLYVLRALNMWDANNSDFVVLKDQYTVSLKLPLEMSLLNRLSKYGLRRVGGYAECDVPLYEISYEISWREDGFTTNKLIVITPYINDEVLKCIVEEAKKIAKGEVS